MNMLWMIMICSLFVRSCSFIRYPFGPPFQIKTREHTQTIFHPAFKDIHGFYGMIGPDVNATSVKSLYHLFTGDGVVHGVFFDKGNLTYVNHFVRTDKILYEEENGRMPRDILSQLFFMMIEPMGWFPNILGLANTALLHTRQNNTDQVYATFERDVPYLLDINMTSKTIRTVKKDALSETTRHYSGHTKYNPSTNTIETIDYHVLSQTVYYKEMSLDSSRTLKRSIEIHTKYIPVVHDFVSLPDSIIIVDSPILIKTNSNATIPVTFHPDMPTYIYVVNKNDGSLKNYTIPCGFYLFHYGDVRETKNTIEIYAPIYNNLSFSSLDLKGTYSKIVLHKEKNVHHITTTSNLQQYNLEFPVKWRKHTILRNFKNRKADGFIICRDLHIVKKLFIKNRSICGEPCVIENNKLIFFTTENQQSFLCMIDLQSLHMIEVPIIGDVKVGFHSLFLHSSG